MGIPEEGVFPHQCIADGCEITVEFDDEPWCFTHSPDEGSSVPGWSARQEWDRYKKVQQSYVKKLLNL